MNYLSSDTYHSKVLLFGEYGILYGSKALAIPYRQFGGKLVINGIKDSNLIDFYNYILTKNKELTFKLNTTLLGDHIKRGLWFKSNIPVGYGLGSSGALTAAIYKEYNIQLPRDISSKYKEIKSDLSLLESFFHGNSSGFDPLVSFINSPVVYEDLNVIRTIDVELKNNFFSFYLIDSGIQGKTSNQIIQFKEKLNTDKIFGKNFLKTYINYSDKAVDALVRKEYMSVFRNISLLSEFQLHNMSGLIPSDIRKLFEYGLQSGQFALKLCGSGGGGYFLVLTKSDFEINSIFDMSYLSLT